MCCQTFHVVYLLSCMHTYRESLEQQEHQDFLETLEDLDHREKTYELNHINRPVQYMTSSSKVDYSNCRDYLVNQETQDLQAYLVERDFPESMYTIV